MLLDVTVKMVDKDEETYRDMESVVDTGDWLTMTRGGRTYMLNKNKIEKVVYGEGMRFSKLKPIKEKMFPEDTIEDPYP